MYTHTSLIDTKEIIIKPSQNIHHSPFTISSNMTGYDDASPDRSLPLLNISSGRGVDGWLFSPVTFSDKCTRSVTSLYTLA